jgi:signal transduction histidine kinase
MATIPFTVSARTAKLIGMENFSNASGAIIELVKNAYDADSKACIIVFHKVEDRPQTSTIPSSEENLNRQENSPKKSQNYNIYIIDNGSGMTDVVLKNQWMTIGTDDKLINYESDKKRIKTGAKGIGRFALNRLGKIAELFTVPEKSENPSMGYSWKVDWENFDKPGIVINDVKAELNVIPSLSIKDTLNSIFSKNQKILNEIKKLSFKHGTIIKITSLNDIWDDNSINKIYSDLELLIPSKEQPFFEIYFYSSEKDDGFGLVPTAYYDDYDYMVKAHYLSDENKTINIEITRNELDVRRLSNEFRGVFEVEKMKTYPYRLRDFKEKTIHMTQSLNEFKGFSENVDQELLEKIGEFSFTFYFVKNSISDEKKDSDLQKYPYKEIISANRKAWLKKFGGIKIFRDDFRVRPYGENGDDWLLLGERQAQSPGGAGQRLGGYRIRPNQISGTIMISRINNELFQDKSGREGLQETPAFGLFKNILIEIIHKFEEDRNTIMFCLSELYKKTYKEDIGQKAKDISEKINKGRKTSEDPKEQLEILARGYSELKDELEDKDEEIRLLRNLASTGLIISSFAHELDNIRIRLNSRAEFLSENLKQYISEKEVKNIPRQENPYYMVQIIQKEDIKLKHWLNYSINSLRSDKRKRKNIDINTYFQEFKSIWNGVLSERQINLELKNLITDKYSFRGFEIDLDSIFNNLLSNSIYALSKINDNKKISIKYSLCNEFIEIVFRDNGKGLSQEYHKNPNVIFNSFETSKKDNVGKTVGTGLGLYIVKSVIEQYKDAFVNIVEYKQGFTLKIGLKIKE